MAGLCAYYAPILCCNHCGLELMGRHAAHHAPTKRPPYILPVLPWGKYAPTMRPLCTHDAPSIRLSRLGLNSMGRPRAHSAPTLRQILVLSEFQPFRNESAGPTVRLLCAYNVLTKCFNRLG